jgi:predicted Zn-dependent protease
MFVADLSEAAVAYQKAAVLEPEEPQIWIGLARVYEAQGKLTAGLKASPLLLSLSLRSALSLTSVIYRIPGCPTRCDSLWVLRC